MSVTSSTGLASNRRVPPSTAGGTRFSDVFSVNERALLGQSEAKAKLLTEKIAQERLRRQRAETEIEQIHRNLGDKKPQSVIGSVRSNLNPASLEEHDRWVEMMRRMPGGKGEEEWMRWQRKVARAERRDNDIPTSLEYCGQEVAEDVGKESHRLMLATKRQHCSNFSFGPDWDAAALS